MLMLAIITQAHSHPNAKRPFSLPALSPPKYSHCHTSETYSWLSARDIMSRKHIIKLVITATLTLKLYMQNMLVLWNKKATKNCEQMMKKDGDRNHELVRGSKEWERVGRNKNRRGKEKKTIIQDRSGH